MPPSIDEEGEDRSVQSFETSSTGGGGGGDTAPDASQQAESSQLRGSSDSSTKPKVTSPIMGGLTTMEGYDMKYSGGIPRADWTGLDPKHSVVGFEDPNQLRPDRKPQEGFNRRTKGLESKFSRKGDLSTFAIKVQDHFDSHGMDSTLYLPDPESDDTMISIIGHHPRFSVETVRQL